MFSVNLFVGLMLIFHQINLHLIYVSSIVINVFKHKVPQIKLAILG